MKLNKRERIAVDTLRLILDALEEGQPILITYAERTAVRELLGIELKEVTHRKKEVKKFIRGKDGLFIVFRNPFSDWSYENKVKSHGFFPFQIKEFKPVKEEEVESKDEVIQ